MDSDGVKVFHAANRNAVACAVTHGFKFNFLPAVDVFFNKNLSDGGEVKTCFCNNGKLLGILGNSAASAAEGECRSDDYGIADFLCYFKSCFNIVCNF